MLRNILITGGSRGIGLAIAKRLARDPCRIILASKSIEPHPKLEGTLASAAKEVISGVNTDPKTKCEYHFLDLRNRESIIDLTEKIEKDYGGKLDVLVNNASAIDNRATLDLPLNKYDLITDINSKGTYLITRACLPLLLKSAESPKVVTLSPPVIPDLGWFEQGGVAYTQSKYQMSLMTTGMAAEFEGKVDFFSLWPERLIWTAATRMLLGAKGEGFCRSPEIMAEAAYSLLNGDSDNYTNGEWYTDQYIMESKGVDSNQYNLSDREPLTDLYVGSPKKFEHQMKLFRP